MGGVGLEPRLPRVQHLRSIRRQQVPGPHSIIISSIFLAYFTSSRKFIFNKCYQYFFYINMDIPDVPRRCLNILLPRCIRRLVEEPPAPLPIRSRDIQVLDLITNFKEKYKNIISEDEIKQARNLASGHSDIVVILERPAPNHDYSVDSEKFIIDCPTLKAVDELIKLATKGKRSIQSVSVFDAHSFKPNGKEMVPTDEDCYLLLEEMLKAKRPKVVICCWGNWKKRCSNPFVYRFLGGGIGRQKIHDEVNIEDWDCVAIRSFHPSVALRYKKYDADFRALLAYHFIAAFTELSHRIEEPYWLLEIANRSKSSWE